MKKYLLLFCLFVVTLSACNKDQFTAQKAVDDAKIQAYIKANNLTGMIKDPSGLYYSVIKPGTGAYPIVSYTATSNTDPNTGSTFKAIYTLGFLNGQILSQDESLNGQTLNKGTLIDGFFFGLPHINSGGRILLLIPSALGYGTAGNGNIPANACLVYTVDLISFY